MPEQHPTKKALIMIQRFVKKNKYFPSTRDIAVALNVSSGSAGRYILALEEMKLLERNPKGNIISIVEGVPKTDKWFVYLFPSNYGKRDSNRSKK